VARDVGSAAPRRPARQHAYGHEVTLPARPSGAFLSAAATHYLNAAPLTHEGCPILNIWGAREIIRSLLSFERELTVDDRKILAILLAFDQQMRQWEREARLALSLARRRRATPLPRSEPTAIGRVERPRERRAARRSSKRGDPSRPAARDCDDSDPEPDHLEQAVGGREARR
jgi:hypothetical protein